MDPPLEPYHSAIRDGFFHDSIDTHNALEHYGLFSQKQEECGKPGLEHLVYSDGAILRRFYQGRAEGAATSGDCVACWAFAYSLLKKENRPVGALKKAVLHYVKNLGTKSITWESAGWVSARCNNFGINYCPDGWKGLGQPMAGPQFWTSSSLLALAYRDLGGIWKLIFWAHFWLMGGPLWVLSPQLYTRKNKLGYSRDIVMRSLWCHLDVFGTRWWVVYPMKFIGEFIAEGYPALHEAMLGKDAIKKLPVVMGPWHSQDILGSSFTGNIWITPAIEQVRARAKELGLNGHY